MGFFTKPFVCVCNQMSERAIRRSIRQTSATAFDDFLSECGMNSGCGSCHEEVYRMWEDHAQRPVHTPLFQPLPVLSASNR
jgi:bacterioferritin-associated ferredoxin